MNVKSHILYDAYDIRLTLNIKANKNSIYLIINSKGIAVFDYLRKYNALYIKETKLSAYEIKR